MSTSGLFSLNRVIVYGLSFLGLTGLAFFLYVDHYYLNTSTLLTEEKTVLVPPGTPVRKIAALLETENVAQHPFLFTLAWYIHGRVPMQTGEYRFTPHDTSRTILRKLIKGDVYYRRLVIPEGYTTAQVLAALKTAEMLQGPLPDEVEEGVFLPDTYFYTYGETRNALIARMMQSRDTILHTMWSTRKNTALSLQQAVILASLVEKETGKDEERPLVAAVFLNRLKKGIALQSDPTVIYALTEGKVTLKRQLTYKDLAVRSPYNTYLYPGLPPGPICNPGIKSLEAVLNPANEKYLYFVADGEGGHYFARTLKEHNRNVARYKKKIGKLGN